MTGPEHATHCRCGHPLNAHQHHRQGTDCALCDCPQWRPARRGRRAQ
jgi:hypothetical protein